MGPVFGVSKTSISGFVAVGSHCAQQKTCCRIGGWNHHSGHRAIIFCDNCTPRSAIVFLTPGQLAGQMHAPRIHFKEHMNTEKTRFATPNLAPKTGSIFGPTICSLPYWGLVLGAAGWSPKRASQLSFFSPPFALSFGAQYLASMAAAATILCVPDRLHHQRVYLLKVSLHNHNHMRSTQLLRLQAYTHNEGPQPRSQKCLFLRPQKQACWKFPCALIIICYQHSYHECRHTHTQREGPWMQGMVFCKKEASFFGPVAFNVGATRRDIQGNIHSVWTMIAHAAMEFRRIFLALVWHGSLQCGSARGYKGRAR